MYVSAAWVLLLIIFLSVKSSSQVSPVPDNSHEYIPSSTRWERTFIWWGGCTSSAPPMLWLMAGVDHIFVVIQKLECGLPDPLKRSACP